MWKGLVITAACAFLAGCEAPQRTSPPMHTPEQVAQTEPEFKPLTVAIAIQSHPEHPESGEVVLVEVENYLLNRYPHIRIVERMRLKQVLAEKHLQESDLMSQETAASVGKVIGADALIVGSVQTWLSMTRVKPGRRFYGVEVKDPKIELSCTAGFTVRLVDVGSASIWLATTAHKDGCESFGEACQKALRKKKVRATLDNGLRRRSGLPVTVSRK
jgi:curli biogenesis system outer membrane secretion channel CsgG